MLAAPCPEYHVLIRLGFEITHSFPEPTPMLLTLNLHDSRRADIAIAKELRTSPAVPLQQYHDGFGNICNRSRQWKLG